MAQFALRWILMFDAVFCAIPGGKRSSQVAENCAASDLPVISPETMAAVRQIYDVAFVLLCMHAGDRLVILLGFARDCPSLVTEYFSASIR